MSAKERIEGLVSELRHTERDVEYWRNATVQMRELAVWCMGFGLFLGFVWGLLVGAL